MTNSNEDFKINNIINNFQKGNIESSTLEMKKFINNNPENEIALYNYGFMLDQSRHHDEANKQYNKVIKINPNNWKAKFNLYINYIKENKFEKSLLLINDVLKIKKNYQPALRDKALILYNLKKADLGLNFILDSLQQNKNDYIALNILGLIYKELHKYDLAEKAFNKAIKINPNYAASYNNLGHLFYILNKKDLAFINFNEALKINPNFQEAINNIANYYNNNGNYKKAIKLYLEAKQKNLKLNEKILFNMAISYMNLENYELAEKYFKKAYKLEPNSGKLKQNYGILLLSMQRFKEAWFFYEGRLKLDEFKLKNDQINIVKKKLWNGKIIEKNKKILIIKEQGVGDEILYSSMYGEAIKQFKNIKIETDSRLINLFTNSFNSKVFVPISTYSNSIEKLKPFDIVIYAASLGKIFRNKISNFPQTKFLFASKSDISNFDKKLLTISTKKKIGISWKSANKNTGDDKSLDLDLLFPILRNKKFTFINMQYGNTESVIKKFNDKFNLQIFNINEVDLFNDFDSMSGLIKNLDLFISVSSSTAHLAAALGVETWIIKPKNHVLLHYWNYYKNTSLWYPNVKLFPHKKNWNDTICKITEELNNKFN